MALYQKGEMSRAVILEKARKLLNERGLTIGVETIAHELGLSRGRITHFFPTKDSIMVGIMRDYEFRLGELTLQFNWNQGSLFDQYFSVFDIILDLQYEYRCSIMFFNAMGKDQAEIYQHVQSYFFSRLDGIKMRVKMMVESKLLEASILENNEMEVFLFQFTGLLSHWVISHEMYYRQIAYHKMKPVYIKGAMQLFVPYLTRKGRNQYDSAAADFTKRSIDHNTKKK